MRLRLPWFRKKQVEKPPPPPLATVMATQTEETGRTSSEQGSDILHNSKVESEELGALAKLPPFRPVVISLVRMFDRDDVKLDEVASLIQGDPSLVSEILAVVNSALFGFQRNVANASHAISLLGVERTKSLAATLAMRAMMQGAPRTPVVRRFWVHSIATATIAKSFASSFGVEPELSNVTALMHDLGRSGLLAAHPAEYSRVALSAHANTEEILAAEETAFGMTHCHAGRLLARAWNLPAAFHEVAGHHHDAGSTKPGVALVQLACRLADDFMFQAIHRTDTQKPADTIAKYAPERLRTRLEGQLESVTAAVDAAIQTLDF